MTLTVLHPAAILVTMDEDGREIADGAMACRDGGITAGADVLCPCSALRLATCGGAEMPGRRACGALTVGRRADLAMCDVASVASTGTRDPVAGLVLCPPGGVRDLFVEGRAILWGGELRSAPLPAILAGACHSVAWLQAT